MNTQAWIVFGVVGLLAGFLAGRILKGSGFGAFGNLIIGVLGALVGGFLFSLLGMRPTNLIGDVATATAGSIVLIFLLSFVGGGSPKRARR